jgi:sulfite reductase (NADPH) flavoprotein alpha-component
VSNKKLQQLHLALSREEGYEYVSHLLTRDQDFIGKALASGGILMICGSLSMQKDVLAALELICNAHNLPEVETYQDQGQILTDCY